MKIRSLKYPSGHLEYCFFFIDFCPKIKFRNVHVMEHLGEFHKSTRRGDFVKIFEMCTKWSIFENPYLFLNERIRFIKITHIFSQNTSTVNPQNLPLKYFSGSSRRKCAQSGENPITRESPKICMFWSIWGVY